MTVVFHIAGDKTNCAHVARFEPRHRKYSRNQAPTWRNETTTEVVLPKSFYKANFAFDRSSRVYRTALTYADLSAYMKVKTC